MTKYILFSFLSDYDVPATLVSVPYNSESERDYLLLLLRTGGSRDEADQTCLDLIYNYPSLLSPILMWNVTHFVQQD